MRIAINGAGVAGPTLAYWLERSGHEPVLIEQAPRLRTGGYMIDFWGVGYTVAERMGIVPAVEAAGYRVRELRVVDRRGRTRASAPVEVFVRMTGDRFTSLARSDLAAAVHGAVGDRVETVFGDSIAAIDEHGAGVRVGFEHGAERDFDLVVGADGLHSRVRALAFGPEARFEHRIGYHVAAFTADGYRPRDELVYVSYATPGRQAARFAERGDRTLFLLVFADDLMPGPEPHDAAGGRAAVRRVFDGAGWECAAILDAMDRAAEVYFDRVSQIRMDRWSRGRVVLLGDAAACVSLLAGEGAGLAMTAAYVLAGELERADGDHLVAFPAYEARLRGFIEGKQRAAEGFATSFAPRTRLGVLVRALGTRLLRVPVLARLLVGSSVRDDFDLPDYGT